MFMIQFLVPLFPQYTKNPHKPYRVSVSYITMVVLTFPFLLFNEKSILLALAQPFCTHFGSRIFYEACFADNLLNSYFSFCCLGTLVVLLLDHQLPYVIGFLVFSVNHSILAPSLIN